ncbi:MAG: hypothetical protein N3G21_12945 [Candidatus Hydrogenedentes bacterium]|nr:hypothetical protein [Candidatus Hydrogenedentota bacterium]
MGINPNWDELKSLLRECAESTGNPESITRDSHRNQSIIPLEHTEDIFHLVYRLVEEVEVLSKRVGNIEKKLERLTKSELGDTVIESVDEANSSRVYGTALPLENIKSSLRAIREQINLLKNKYSPNR